MRLNPSLVLIVTSVFAIAVAFTLMMLGALWARVRSMPVEETTRLVDDLARRQESIEALLYRLEQDRDPGPPVPPATVGPSNAGAGASAEVRTGPAPAQRADRSRPSAVGGPTLIVVPSLAAAAPDASSAASTELARRFGAIWALADAGESPESIARTTGQPIGQVELILGLRRQLTTQSAERT